MRRFRYVPLTALGPWLSERFVHLAPASRAQFYLRKQVGTVAWDILTAIGEPPFYGPN